MKLEVSKRNNEEEGTEEGSGTWKFPALGPDKPTESDAMATICELAN